MPHSLGDAAGDAFYAATYARESADSAADRVARLERVLIAKGVLTKQEIDQAHGPKMYWNGPEHRWERWEYNANEQRWEPPHIEGGT